jgi:hypothetical protein
LVVACFAISLAANDEASSHEEMVAAFTAIAEGGLWGDRKCTGPKIHQRRKLLIVKSGQFEKYLILTGHNKVSFDIFSIFCDTSSVPRKS